MLTDIKQAELDAAEELLFNRLLGGTQLSPTADFILKTLNIDAGVKDSPSDNLEDNLESVGVENEE
jgi:hypothetical protein